MTKVIKSEELRGKYHCHLMKELKNEIPTESFKNENYDNAIIVKQIIHGFLTGEFDPAEFHDLVSEGVEENNLPKSTNTRRIERLTGILRRYARAETRQAIMVDALEIPVNADYFIRVKPDAVFNTATKIEAVKYFSGKPAVTQSGRKQDLSVLKCPEIYGLFLYAKSLLKPGETKVIRGSYYYMRKSTDTSKGMIDPDFFSGDGGNVVYFEKEVTYGDNTLSEEEKEYIQQIEASDKGKVECTEEDCKSCSYNLVCNWVKTPELFQKKTLKARGKIELSDEQKEIVAFRKGVARVIATAGSGKTECVSERVTQMIIEGVDPSSILCITFTDAGAAEMKKRIAGKCLAYGVEVNPDDINAMTFNSFAFNIVKENYEFLGFKKSPEVIDDVRNRRIITQMLSDPKVVATLDGPLDYLNFDVNTPNLRGALACVEKTFDIIKTEHIDIEDADSVAKITEFLRESGHYRFMNASSFVVSELCSLYEEYQERLLEDGLITFSDQEPMMFKVLNAFPGYLEKYGLKHIIVDEFQDSNGIQMDTIKEFIKCSCFESLMVVGDDSQSIYGFRHTSPENMIHFFEKLGINGTDINLSVNRRSTPEILKVAGDIEALNKERLVKPMNPAKDHGEPVHVNGFYNKEEELNFITGTVKSLIDSGRFIPEDIAILTYTKAELIAIAAELSKANVPWVIMNPIPLMDNSKVKAAISLSNAFYQPEADKSYLDFISAKYDGDLLNSLTFEEINEEIAKLKNQFMNIDMLTIPYQRQIFHKMLDELKSDKDEIYQYFLDLVYANEDLQSELEYIRDFKVFGKDCCKKMEQTYEGVVLTTAHSSKGLEWPVVINSLNKYDSKFLHSSVKSQRKQKAIEEMRRLLFVSMTRAKDVLYVTGQYEAYSSKEEGRVYNTFLKEVFDVTNTKYVPIDPDAEAKKAAKLKAQSEKIQAKKRRTSTKY